MKARATKAVPRGPSVERARAELAGRLRERRVEIEAALLTRTYAIADPAETADPEYAQGLRAAVSAALEYGLAVVERGEERAPPVPVLLLAQARLAARIGVPLDTVLRRYFAGYTLLGDFIVQEAGAVSLREPWLKRLLREQAALFDRFLAAIGEEHGREGDASRASTEERRAEQVRRLLDGELVDARGLGYELEGHHIGLIAVGPGARETVRSLAGTLDRQLLSVCHDETTIWAWLGGRRHLDPGDVERTLASPDRSLNFALGEPAEGLVGWRLTHRQAAAALSIALRRGTRLVRYADVALIAAVLHDELLVTSLRQLYLAPLAKGAGDGSTFQETLRAYFAADRNVSSAAAALGVTRRTVTNRLRAIEETLDRPIRAIAVDLDIALGLESLCDESGEG